MCSGEAVAQLFNTAVEFDRKDPCMQPQLYFLCLVSIFHSFPVYLHTASFFTLPDTVFISAWNAVVALVVSLFSWSSSLVFPCLVFFVLCFHIGYLVFLTCTLLILVFFFFPFKNILFSMSFLFFLTLLCLLSHCVLALASMLCCVSHLSFPLSFLSPYIIHLWPFFLDNISVLFFHRPFSAFSIWGSGLTWPFQLSGDSDSVEVNGYSFPLFSSLSWGDGHPAAHTASGCNGIEQWIRPWLLGG